MNDLLNGVRSVVDQLNPYNTGNLVLYFSWVVVFSYTVIGLLRSQRRWVRVCCFAVNQLFSFGMVVSLTVTALLAYTYWWQSLTTAAVTLVIAWIIFSGD